MHTLVVVMSCKPRASCQSVNNNLCYEGMHTFEYVTKLVYYTNNNNQNILMLER